jgi:hypothetical protein
VLGANYPDAMKAQTISFTLAAALAALGAGCASSSDPYASSRTNNPNQTARGAAAGAAAGAVLGGIIGNNAEHGNTEKGAAIGAVAGGIAGAAAGRRADQREDAAIVRSQEATYTGGYTVQSIPPSPVSEPQENPPPQPTPNAVWIRGHYTYTGNGYQWEPGRWETPPPGARAWVQPSWQPAANGGYVYVRGHWQ